MIDDEYVIAPGGRAVTRRVVVAGAGIAAGIVALAGCAGYVGGGAPVQPDTGGAAQGGGGSAGGSGGAAALAKTADIPVGGGKIFPAQQVVVTQPAAGSFKAFTSTCTHQGCTVNVVANGTINCPCHGSKYKVADGSVAGGPAPRGLAPKNITVADGSISLA